MKRCSDLIVSHVEHPTESHVLLRLTSGEPLPEMLPGQFVQVRVDGSGPTFLRRPISINLFDRESNEMWLLIHAVGPGTRQLTRLREGDRLNCVYPLGNGFTLPRKGERVLLVGGGVGTAPMLFLGRKATETGAKPTFLLGAKTEKGLLQISDFQHIGHVCITTEDGSRGERGFVTDHSVLKETFSRIQVCGPKPMMEAMARHAKRRGTECEVSLENLMACGLGACLCCVEKTVDGNLCVCKEGPVFNANRLLWHI